MNCLPLKAPDKNKEIKDVRNQLFMWWTFLSCAAGLLRGLFGEIPMMQSESLGGKATFPNMPECWSRSCRSGIVREVRPTWFGAWARWSSLHPRSLQAFATRVQGPRAHIRCHVLRCEESLLVCLEGPGFRLISAQCALGRTVSFVTP